ncbi:hypothetical protein [Actibacterium sp. 188UL27-1]|uniref:hypothetical protein n=1 Tax=Actibacterium sp. 188UL27-1 TaxID=2786961 RepID=UPI001958702B|nr:hypothetical protein [Actibacterium sp. 188UL27-1]MBM7070200.1 hypothetical protein [Actibacterium sp. 188UL27-1]
MPKRSSPADAEKVEVAQDIDALVFDKRADWRATAAKGRRRQRRYKKRLTQELARLAHGNSDLAEDYDDN